MKKILLSTALLSCFVFAKDVNVGVVLPLTGPVAAYGQDVLAGVELANKIMPKAKNGDTINLVVLDSKGDKVETSTAALRLVSKDKVVAIIGEATTPNTMQVISVAEDKKVPMIAPVASGDKLLDNKKYSSRVCFMDSFQGQKFADYAIDTLKYKSVAMVVDQANVYSLGLAKVFETQFKKRGGKVLKKLMISSNDKDFKAIISQLQSVKPDFVYMPIYHPEAALITKQARALGFNTPFSAGDGVNNKTFIELGGEAVNDFIFTDSFDYNNPSTALGKSFVDRYEKEKKTREVPAFAAMGADAYFVTLNAINNCAASLTSECINNEIHKTTKLEVVGGVISIDSSGNAKRPVIIKEIKNGKQSYKATVNP